VAVLAAFSAKNGISYPLLSDQGSEVIRRLGLLNVHIAEQQAFYGVAMGPRHEGLPYPGTFLLDANGVITQKRFYQSYRERETGAGMLEDAFQVESSEHGPEARFASPGVTGRALLDSATYRNFQRLYLTVELNIEPGLHVYGRPIPEDYLALTVDIAPLEGLDIGPPRMPSPRPFRLEGLDEQFFVYEDNVKVSLPLTFTMREAGDLVVRLSVRYQACSTSDCLPPASVSLELPVSAAAFVPSATPVER